MKKALIVLFGLTLALAFIAGYSPAKAQKDQIKLKVFVHYPNPGRPIAQPTCSESASTTPDDYLSAGWHMPSLGMDYKINLSSKPRNLTDGAVQAAVADSFATWTADPDQKFTYEGPTLAKNAKYDGTNAILFKGISGSAIAMTYVWYYTDTGLLAEVDTAFNKNLKWSYTPYTSDCGGVIGTYDLQNIGTHEFGHWIGLDDLYGTADKDLTMFGYGDLKELKKDSLGAGDITGVNAIAP